MEFSLSAFAAQQLYATVGAACENQLAKRILLTFMQSVMH